MQNKWNFYVLATEMELRDNTLIEYLNFGYGFLNFWPTILCPKKVSSSDVYIREIYLKLLIFCPLFMGFFTEIK